MFITIIFVKIHKTTYIFKDNTYIDYNLKDIVFHTNTNRNHPKVYQKNFINMIKCRRDGDRHIISQQIWEWLLTGEK